MVKTPDDRPVVSSDRDISISVSYDAGYGLRTIIGLLSARHFGRWLCELNTQAEPPLEDLRIGDPVTVNAGTIWEFNGIVVPQNPALPPGEVNIMECGTGSVAIRRLDQITRRV